MKSEITSNNREQMIYVQILQITKNDSRAACLSNISLSVPWHGDGMQNLCSATHRVVYICRIRVVMKDQNSIVFRERVSHAQHCAAA